MPRQHAFPEDYDVYNEESSESNDDSTADGGKEFPRSKTSLKKSQIWFNFHAYARLKINCTSS